MTPCRTLTWGCFCVLLLLSGSNPAPKTRTARERGREWKWKEEKSSRAITNSTKLTRIHLDLTGPNVCGPRCCSGWTVQLKTKQCTKPRCLPRCHNKAVCLQPNTCQCRPGFSGHRCEQRVWFWTPSNETSTFPASIESPASDKSVTPVIPIIPNTINTVIPVIPNTNNMLIPITVIHVTLPPAVPVIPSTLTTVTPLVIKTGLWGSGNDSSSDRRRKDSLHWQPLSLKKTLLKGVGGSKIADILLKHIETERNRLKSGTQSSSTKSFHTQRGHYTLIYTPASGQAADGQRTFGILGKSERIKVLFTPTVCRLRCSQNRCTNYCERGNITTIYNSDQQGPLSSTSTGFRMFLCPMLCKNGGVCVQKDRCLCPPNFTGKFCHIPVLSSVSSSVSSISSTNDIEKMPSRTAVSANQEMIHSEYILPLQSPEQSQTSGSPMVKVRVHHPPEASVKIHQVLKVGPTVHERSETVTWSAGLSGSRSSIILPGERAEAPPPQAQATFPRIQAQTIRGDSSYTESSGFKYCFREVRNGQCSSPMPGLRSKETCCRGDGLAWGISECTLCLPSSGSRGRGDGGCPKGFERVNGTQCVAQKVISSEKDQCFRILAQGTCSVPILRNITKQICCCSRVGKAWGRKCEACPHFGSAGFKEICPAGPGYHYFANTLNINPRPSEPHTSPLVIDTKPEPPRTHQQTHTTRLQPAQTPQTDHTRLTQPRTQDKHKPAAASQPIGEQPAAVSTQTGRPVHRQPLRPLPLPATSRPAFSRTDSRVCESRPQVCGPGRCVDVAGGKHTCVCNPGYILNSQAGHCQDINECVLTPRPCSVGQCENTVGSFRCVCPAGYQSNTQQNQCSDVDECVQVPAPCPNGRCENTFGSFRCVCRVGFKLQGNTCTDIDECDDPLRCPGQECLNTLGSYRCKTCSPGFGLLNGQCSDIDECRQSPLLCTNGRCENTPGSYRCVCKAGFRIQGNTCADVNECEDPLRCPDQECLNSQGSYRCVSCSSGFTLINGRCSDIDECVQVPAPCTNGLCENTQGSFKCVCRVGFRLQANTCTDVNECENPRLCPGQECLNTPGSYRCESCRSGYTFRNGQCSDVDECENELQCPGQKCVNLPGSFNCVPCNPGFEIVNGQCTDMDECSQTPAPCSNGHCENTHGSFKCVCRRGFKLQGNTCIDIDECESSGVCGLQSVCVNTEGSYRCECVDGYRATGPGRQCRDINECLDGDFCFPHGECMNTVGSYVCLCAQGFQTSANKTSCQDVDECTREGVCQDGRCVNTAGSFLCNCKTGFTTNPEKTACLDVDECVDSEGAVCGSLRCENTIGSFHCLIHCQPGYSITSTGECVDINECANDTVCGVHAFCQNLIGTYQCICDQGYESIGDGRSCTDINECETMVGVCGAASCWNVEGSFTCECEGQQEFNPRTLQCVSRARPDDEHVSVLPEGSSSSPSRPGSGSSLPPAAPGEKRECYYNIQQQESCSILTHNSTLEECCCTVGQGWGLHCVYFTCPQTGTAEFQNLCPSGQGHVTSAVGAFSYKDVDECKLFDPVVCKGGVCVNNIPGYSCYCPNGYYHDTVLMECIDNNECENEEMCPGGMCINTIGSYYCTCEPPLVLDDTQRNCVNISSFAVDETMSYCWRTVTADLVCQNLLREFQVTFVECCCRYGEAWGLNCALCPRRDEEAYEAMCSAVGPPPNSPRYFDHFAGRGGGGGGGGGGGVYPPPYGDTVYREIQPARPGYSPDYDDYAPVVGTNPRSGLRARTPGSYPPYITPGLRSGSYYEDEDYDMAPAPPFGSDPRSERAFGTRPRPPLAESRPLSLAPLPEEQEGAGMEPWTSGAPYPPFTDRRVEGDRPRRVYERQYEPYAGLMEGECGILQGCENGRCVRVGEGYTCDCYDGFQLDVSSMTCIDVNECEDQSLPKCSNGQCVNTEGSYRCVCHRGFVMSRRPNHCIPA
ncbi:latent-transforming growth factor beta-binding protein 4 isoform X2 [Hoplias malabaricus]|uniref:latent-transforming growth factor beta-binding protein 4 isoform X2 n=1 Tax=Hoplias malabaricus TaxID=27720 RepID=UPI0034621882